ncbi:hypothetical protein HispidOSU_023608 [Sigmodon hispidus]
MSALVFEIILATSRCWRQWEFDSKVVKFLSIGLWEAYYHKEVNISGSVTNLLVHVPINSTWAISSEFQYLQILIVWAILMNIIVLIFSSVAIKISFMKDPFTELQIFCYNMSIIILGVTSIFTFIAVSFNYLVDIYGQTTPDFPPYIPVKKEDIIKKHHTAVLPIGLLTSNMSLFGVIIFFYEMSSIKLQNKMKAQCASKLAERKA